MPFPSDISLSSNSKYFGVVDSTLPYNLNWDVVWSFTYALSGTQHGFCTFLTTNPTLTGSIPGQYLGYHGLSGVLGIGFDSTGFFALSTPIRPGVPLSGVKRNSLVIRDSNYNVIFNESLSSLDTDFILASATKTYQTLRFRYCNSGKKLYIDYKNPLIEYKNLTTLSISSLVMTDNLIVYPGFTFCSPISGTGHHPSTMMVKNFHSQGSSDHPTYEIVPMIQLRGSISNTYTSLSGISAFPTPS